MNFISDGVAYCHDDILKAIVDDRPRATASHDADEVNAKLHTHVSDIFETEVDIFMVTTGTASVGLSLAAMTTPYGAIYSHEDAHIQTDECGAPGFFTGGAKLISVPGKYGKMDPENLQEVLAGTRIGNPHVAQPQALTVTQITEAGTYYSNDELGRLCDLAKSYEMSVHIDGARFGDAVVSEGKSPADMSWRLGVDILSLGATKNGAICADMIVVFNRNLAEKLRYLRKSTGHMMGKSRLFSVQMLSYLTNDLWLKNARASIASAEKLEAVMTSAEGVRMVHPRQANGLFLEMPDDLADLMQNSGIQFYRGWRRRPQLYHRMMTNFQTTQEDLDAVAKVVTNFNASKNKGVMK